MSKIQNDFGPGSTPALIFHRMAEEFLSRYKFSLVNNPNTVYSPYQASRGIYRNKNGLHLCFWFDPFDGSNCGISGGRYWCSKGVFLGKEKHFLGLSGDYSKLAKISGCEVPNYYSMKLGDEMKSSMEPLLSDLKASLPLVLDNLVLSDLVAFEKEDYGVESRSKQYFGENFLDHVEISVFPKS